MTEHVDYPHEPGRLYGCPVCEASCHCTPGTSECIFEGPHRIPELNDFTPGMRVQTHPATQAWWQGDRYGEVTKIGRLYVHVKMERSGRTLHLLPLSLLFADQPVFL